MSDVSKTLKQMQESALLTLHTCLLCRVLEVDSESRTAKVQPLTYTKTTDGTVKAHAILGGVPFTQECAENVVPNAVAVVLFAERDITIALQNQGALPPTTRHHSLADGIIIGTIGQ